jgi:hypothetical protein
MVGVVGVSDFKVKLENKKNIYLFSDFKLKLENKKNLYLYLSVTLLIVFLLYT